MPRLFCFEYGRFHVLEILGKLDICVLVLAELLHSHVTLANQFVEKNEVLDHIILKVPIKVAPLA